MSLNYVSANSLNNSIDRLSDLVSYTVPPVQPRTAKSLTVTNVTSVTAPGSPPISGQNALSFNGSSSTIQILNAAASWAATGNNTTDGGTNGKLWFMKQGQLTVEHFIYYNSLSGAGFMEWGSGGLATGYGGSNFYYWAQSQNSYGLTWSSSPSINTWYHIAWTRTWASGSDPTYTLYINGTTQGSFTGSYTYQGTTPFGTLTTPYIGGGNGSGGFYFNGYMQELRISNISRYSGNFTPTTTPFVNDANTVLLIHGTSPIVDDNS